MMTITVTIDGIKWIMYPFTVEFDVQEFDSKLGWGEETYREEDVPHA